MWNGIQIGTRPLSTQTHQHIHCLSEPNCARLARVTNSHHFLEEYIVEIGRRRKRTLDKLFLFCFFCLLLVNQWAVGRLMDRIWTPLWWRLSVLVSTTPLFRILLLLLLSLPSTSKSKFFSELLFEKSIYLKVKWTQTMYWCITQTWKGTEEDGGMDLTDTAGFGQQTGGNSSVGCRRREMTIVGEEGKGGGNV